MPVYSLYSETREPTAEMLKGLDVLVVDLQDVGSRIYTFIYTMANCLRAGKKHGVPVIVTDRPNPIGGDKIGGPMLVKGFESFVGQFPIPMRHGMTIGELARFFNDACGIGADLTVVPMEGWRRSMYYEETRPAVGDAVAEHADGRNRGRLSGHRAVRGHERLGRARHDAAVRADRRALGRCRGACRETRSATVCPACISGRWCSSRRFRSTPGRRAAVVRFTCSIAQAFRAVERAVAVLAEIRAQDPSAVPMASAAVRVRAREAAVRHPRRLEPAASADRGGPAGADDLVQLVTQDTDGFATKRKPFLLY